jgi:prepilin-type N-terminal cleavage/methylation domain-containing protein
MIQRHRPQSGFTLIETLIAILILSLTIGALLTLTAGGFFSIRYAKNDIVASNLLQESLEYIRNTRDTAAQQGSTWDDWYATYQSGGCTNNDGCIVNPYAVSDTERVTPCSNDCPSITYFPVSGFYGYEASGGNHFDPFNVDAQPYDTSFVRTITFRETTDTSEPQLIITARMEWLNGTNTKSATQSIILSKWNIL